MNEIEMVELLRLYRHDVMNQLQVVSGYASMKKHDKVQEKLQEWIVYFAEERKLMNLEAPKFILWLLTFNSHHDHIHISYKINQNTSMNLRQIDHQLVKECQQAIATLNRLLYDNELYDGEIWVDQFQSMIEVKILLYGEICQTAVILEENGMYIQQIDNGIKCQIKIPLE